MDRDHGVMVKLTLIARVRDGLPLAEGLDTDKEHEMYSYKSQAKVRFEMRGLISMLKSFPLNFWGA